MRQAAGKTARRSGSGLQADCRTRRGLLVVGLTLFWLVIAERLDRSWHRPRAILGERFARQNNVVIVFFDGSAGPTINPAIVCRATAIESAAVVTVTLRGGILRRWQIAAATLTVRPTISIAATSTAAATASKTSPPSTAPAIPVAAAISPAPVSLPTILAYARPIVA